MTSKPDSPPKQQTVLETAPPASRGSPCYQEISDLIAGPDGPPWLPDFLSNWAPSLGLDRNVQARQPGRANMREILGAVGDAAALITRSLGQGSVREFLEDGPLGPMPYLGQLDHSLRDLEARAAQAQGSPRLANSEGKTKAGPGLAAPSRSISPQNYCALFVAEVWRHFHSQYPTVRSQNAARAAEAFWRATGNPKRAWGNSRLPAWRYHFEQVESLEATENHRAEIRRHLIVRARQWERQLTP
jgi:hypothetical protein